MRHFKQALSGRWQLPLLVVSVVVLLTGIGQLSPERVTIPFGEAVDRVVALRQAEQFDLAREALDLLERQEARTPAELARISRLRAETGFFEQQAAAEPSREVARKIIEDYTVAEQGGIAIGPVDRERLGRAYEWVNRPKQALAEYRTAMEGELPDPLSVRRRIIHILRNDPDVTPEALHGELDPLIEATDRRTADLALWATEQKVDLWADSGENEKSLALLDRLRGQYVNTTAREGADYLEALTLFRLKRYDEAERMLRALRDRLNLTPALHARTGWLLGELNLRDGRPQMALTFFQDVLRSHLRGEYRSASGLGAATALAELERFDESLNAFEDVIKAMRRYPDSSVINPIRVRAALTTLGQSMGPDQEKLETKLRFTELAASLVSSQDDRLAREYAGPMAAIYAALAKSKQSLAERLTRPEEDEERVRLLRESRRYYAQAGDAYRRLSRLLVRNEERSASAAWEAVDMYDQAGMTERHIAALREYIGDRPYDVRISEARHRLGRAYHVLGRYEQAIEQYQRNQRDHPRTIDAIRSLVELGAAYMAMGSAFFPQAEEVFLQLLEPATGLLEFGAPGTEPVVTPEAQEFRVASFRLAELYDRQGEHEKAISRLEVALTRYPSDTRATRARFLLADAYRRSAAALEKELDKDIQANRRDQLMADRNARLEQAATYYGEVIVGYDDAPPETSSSQQALYLRLSYFYRADCVFDLGRYPHALGLYEEAALKYENDPAALAGYLRIASCHQQLGKPVDARRVIQRARVLVNKIPSERFNQFEKLLRDGSGGASDEGVQAIGRTREQWESYLQWLAGSKLFADYGA